MAWTTERPLKEEREWLQAGSIAHVVYSMLSGKKARRMKLSDFLPDWATRRLP